MTVSVGISNLWSERPMTIGILFRIPGELPILSTPVLLAGQSQQAVLLSTCLILTPVEWKYCLTGHWWEYPRVYNLEQCHVM